LVITFFYTRCPLPDFCPLMNMNLARIADELDKDPALAKRTVLLSVTFDPKFDTPPVLSQNLALYRNAKRPGAAQWVFATGKPDQIASIAEFIGVWYKEQPDQVTHNLRTTVVTPSGKVEKVFPGNEWKPKEVLRILRQP
jgi:protein SCO1/2